MKSNNELINIVVSLKKRVDTLEKEVEMLKKQPTKEQIEKAFNKINETF